MEIKITEKSKILTRGLVGLLVLYFVNASDADKRLTRSYFSTSGQLAKLDLPDQKACLLMPHHVDYQTGIGHSHSSKKSPISDLKIVSLDSPKVDCNLAFSSFLQFQNNSELVEYLTHNPKIKITTSHSFNSPLDMNKNYYTNNGLYLSDHNQHLMNAEFLGSSDDVNLPELFFLVDDNLTINGTSGAIGYISGLPVVVHTTIFPNISSAKQLQILREAGIFDHENLDNMDTRNILFRIYQKGLLSILQIKYTEIGKLINTLKQQINLEKNSNNSYFTDSIKSKNISKIWTLLFQRDLDNLQIEATNATGQIKSKIEMRRRFLNKYSGQIFKEVVINQKQLIGVVPITKDSLDFKQK